MDKEQARKLYELADRLSKLDVNTLSEQQLAERSAMIAQLQEVKQRLDPKCWKGYKKQGTKMKGDTRVNNCVPESVTEGLESLRAKAKEISDKIDAIVKSGGRVGLDDPLSRQLKAIHNKIKQAKQGTTEGYTVTPGIDKERYQARDGLEGPFSTKSGKVVYYDKAEGKYYDPDTDMYIEYDDWLAMNEGWKEKLGAAALAGSMALGAAGAHARVTPGDDPSVNRLTGKPIATQVAPADQKPAAQSPTGFNKEYLQKAADPNRTGRYMISVEKAQELLKQMGESVSEATDGEYNDEAGMAESNLHTMARAVAGLIKTIESDDNLPEWAQEKIAKAEMMITSVWDYLLSQKEQGVDPKVQESKKPSPKLTPVNIKKTDPVSEEINTEAYERLQKVFAFKNYES